MTEVIVECADVHSKVCVAWEQTAEANLVPSPKTFDWRYVQICSKLTIKTAERRLASFWCLYYQL